MLIVNIHEAKTQLSQLIAAVEQNHETIRICRHGKPVAELIPIQKPIDSLKQYSELQGVKVLCDLTAPLSEEDWPEDYR